MDIERAVLRSRSSASPLAEPAPSDAEISALIGDAATGPDHGWMRPWRLVLVRGVAREVLGSAFAADLPDADVEGRARAAGKPLRAPLLVSIVFAPRDDPKVPEWEQLAATVRVVHGLSLLLRERGWGAMWRTGAPSRSATVRDLLGIRENEQLLGWLYIGTAVPATHAPRPPFDPSSHLAVLQADGAIEPISQSADEIVPVSTGRFSGNRSIDHPHYTCVGIGVGPANLSLASQLYDHPEVGSLFIEEKSHFGWHDGQLIPSAKLQVPMLKDLVTLVDPTSRFSFLSYLHKMGRLYHFINAQFDSVPRAEFRNYLEWAAQLNPNIVFGERVESVDFRDTFVVRTTERVLTCDNIVVGVGRAPWVPQIATLGARQFHVAEFMGMAQRVSGLRVAVVGGGQSGAEAFLDLISRPASERPQRVSWVSRRSNFFPMDDSPFTNDYFMPSHSDHFFNLDRAIRERFNQRHVLASDGITESTLRDIYQKIYALRFMDGAGDMVGLYPNRTVTEVTRRHDDGWDVVTTHHDQPGLAEQIEADMIVWATGFGPSGMDFLAPIAHRLERDGPEFSVDSSFAVLWDGPADRNIFIQNGARDQRGLADSNLSLVAWRSRRILGRLLGEPAEQPDPSFIDWSAKSPALDDRT